MPLTSEPTHWQALPNAPQPGTPLLALEALQDGQALMHSVASVGAGEPTKPFLMLLLRSGNTVKAYANRCAHFGVPLAARQDLLIFTPHTSISCNVHYARYRWEDGLCVSGDCEGESLLSIPVVVNAQGMVCIGPDSV